MFKSKILKIILFATLCSSSFVFGAFDPSRRIIFTDEHELPGGALFQRFARNGLADFNEKTNFIEMLLEEQNPTADNVTRIIHAAYFQYHPDAQANNPEAMHIMTNLFNTVFACDPDALKYIEEKRAQKIQEHGIA